MKRHFLGFAIFSLIVTTAIFVSNFFYIPENIDVPAPAINNSSWKIKREINKHNIPVVKQALLDLDTKQMSWDVYIPETETPVALHFFVKESGAVRYLASEVTPYVSSTRSKNIKYTSSYLWFYHLDSFDNVYVEPEMISPSDYYRKTFDPVFDENKATRVTVYSGKPNFETYKN